MSKSEEEFFSVLPTDRRHKARGNYLVQLHPDDAKMLGFVDGQRVVVRAKTSLALAKVDTEDDLKPGSCRLDLSIRKFLSSDGELMIRIFAVDQHRTPRELFFQVSLLILKILTLHILFQAIFRNHPRRLLLQVRNMRREEVEKNVAVVREKYSDLLGLKSGQYIKIQLPYRLERGKYRITDTSIRMFHGLSPDNSKDKPYPDYDSIYLDSYTRRLIGFEEAEHKRFKPMAIVQPDFSKLFAERILYYVVTFFLLTRQFIALLEYFDLDPRESPYALVFSFLASLWTTTLITHLEIRIRTNY